MHGSVVEGTIVDCKPMAAMRAETLRRWQGIFDDSGPGAPPDWKQRVHAVFDDAKGVVVTVRWPTRYRILEGRADWNRGALRADRDDPSRERNLFLYREELADCAGVRVGDDARVFLPPGTRPMGKLRPPTDDLAALVKARVETPIPDAYLRLVEAAR